MKSTFVKYLLLICVLTALLSISAFAFDVQGGTIDVGSAVNVRQMPNTSSKILDKLYDGEKVAVTDKIGSFYKVSYDNIVGYVHEDYVDLQSVMNVDGGTAKVTASALNMRSGPGTSYKRITTLANGTTAEVIGINDGWVKVNYKGTIGYLSAQYVELISSSSSSGSTSTAAATSEEAKLRQQIVEYTKTFLGVPYVWGGTTPKGFDCSGLVKYVYNHFGISISRTSYEQYNTSVKKISKSELQPGDLIFFTRSDTGKNVGHVGIYVGNGQMIHAPRAGKNVEYASINSTYYVNAYVGCGTMFK